MIGDYNLDHLKTINMSYRIRDSLIWVGIKRVKLYEFMNLKPA